MGIAAILFFLVGVICGAYDKKTAAVVCFTGTIVCGLLEIVTG